MQQKLCFTGLQMFTGQQCLVIKCPCTESVMSIWQWG